MRPRSSSPPLWFNLVVVVVLALALRACMHVVPTLAADARHGAPPSVAFWFFLLGIVEAIWKGVQVAGKITLEILQWSVKALWAFAQTTANGLKGLGQLVGRGLKGVWDFFETTYEKVIKPAWLKFWRWFDKFRRWLDQTFGPVLAWLRQLRDSLLAFWKTWVRPWLDLIDVTRKALRVLSSMGIGWARRLDAYLADLESRIEKPFLFVLSKLNEVINVVNRIVTLDGLLQRIVLIQSIARDYKYVWSNIVAPYSSPIDAARRKELTEAAAARSLAAIEGDLRRYLATGAGPLAASVLVATTTLRQRLAGR
jgi:hypothetical protein